MSSAFTPGPWAAKPASNADDTCRIMWTEYGQGWVRERRLDRDCAGGFSPENARLMAAAPEMFDALEKCRNKFSLYADLHRTKLSNPENDESERLSIQEKITRNEEMRDLCDAAISKVLGEQAQ
jgi:hypothetical protein